MESGSRASFRVMIIFKVGCGDDYTTLYIY